MNSFVREVEHNEGLMYEKYLINKKSQDSEMMAIINHSG
jgi:hypothetical protein